MSTRQNLAIRKNIESFAAGSKQGLAIRGLVVILMLFTMGTTAQAAILHIKYTADKEVYQVGEQISWTASTWTEQDDDPDITAVKVESAVFTVLPVSEFQSALLTGAICLGGIALVLFRIFGRKRKLLCSTNLRKSLALILVLLLVPGMATNAYAADVTLRVETDKAIYEIGDTVQWTIYAKASEGDNRGILQLKLDLSDSKGDELSTPLMNPVPPEFLDTDFTAAFGFVSFDNGSIDPNDLQLDNVRASQTGATKTLDFGNQGSEKLFAKGEYTVNTPGQHFLIASPNQPNSKYWSWPDGAGAPVVFETALPQSTSFITTFESDINHDMYVNFKDYAIMAKHWKTQTICTAPDWCEGGDIDRDSVVDEFDLEFLASQWLQCVDPANPNCI